MSHLWGTFVRSATVSVATILGQAPAVAFPLLVATLFGASSTTDRFFIAFAFASFVLNALAGATQHAIVPYIVELETTRAGRFAASAHGASLLATAFGVLLLGIGSIAGSAGGDGHAEVVRWLWTLVPFMFLASTANLWAGVLNARKRYLVAAVSPAARWLPLLALIWLLGPRIGFVVVPIGYVAGELIRVAFLYRSMHSTFGPGFSLVAAPSQELVPFMRTGSAQILGSAVIAFLPFMDRIMASWLEPGSVSILDYAERLWQVPLGLMMSGLLVVSLAEWSDERSRSTGIDTVTRRTALTARTLCLASLVPIALLVFFRARIVAILLGGSGLTQADLALLANTLGAYMVGVPLYLMGLTYGRTYLVMRRSDWLLGVSVIQLAAKLVLNALLMRRIGLPGIALATSAIYGLGSLILMWALHAGLVKERARTQASSS